MVKQQFLKENKPHFDVEIYDYGTRTGKFWLSAETTALGKSQIVESRYVIVASSETETTFALYSIPNKKIASFGLHKTKHGAAKLNENLLIITDELRKNYCF